MKPTLTLNDAIILALFTSIATVICNLFFQYIKDSLDWFRDIKKFKREHSFNQLKELYLKLYGIIAQSEYLRYFWGLDSDFVSYPFLEIKKKKIQQRIDFNNRIIEGKTFELIDAVTEFNKLEIAKIVLDKSQYSSQNLLKLAVAYRFVHEFYTDDTMSAQMVEKFQTEELFLIAEIVKTVVRESNQMLKDCDFDYNSQELNTGIMDTNIFK